MRSDARASRGTECAASLRDPKRGPQQAGISQKARRKDKVGEASDRMPLRRVK